MIKILSLILLFTFSAHALDKEVESNLEYLGIKQSSKNLSLAKPPIKRPSFASHPGPMLRPAEFVKTEVEVKKKVSPKPKSETIRASLKVTTNFNESTEDYVDEEEEDYVYNESYSKKFLTIYDAEEEKDTTGQISEKKLAPPLQPPKKPNTPQIQKTVFDQVIPFREQAKEYSRKITKRQYKIKARIHEKIEKLQVKE